jgi:hypothetical protein
MRWFPWPALIASSILFVATVFAVCAAAMFVLSGFKRSVPNLLRTSVAAACLAPLEVFLHQDSIWAPVVAAFLVWNVIVLVDMGGAKKAWVKFAGSFGAAVLLQVGIAAAIADQVPASALAIGLVAAPIAWRIRQERPVKTLKPLLTAVLALLMTVLSLTYYLPVRFASGVGMASIPKSAGKKVQDAQPGFSSGGKFRGVILMPEQERHIVLVPPLPMMGHDPFESHKEPIGIPFYGVYWFFQTPDQAPDENAYRTKGTPDNVAFHSADFSPLEMEAHQTLGRLIDVSSCSRIDVAIRNADHLPGSVALELLLVNTSLRGHPSQPLGQAAITRSSFNETTFETLSFKIPSTPVIRQFDELTIKFPRAPYRATRSARIAIERFYLVPRGR